MWHWLLFSCYLSWQCALTNADATAACSSFSAHRNNIDLYADPNDCHKYFQCNYIGESVSAGYHRTCPPLQYWSSPVSTCVPETFGRPCEDPCQLNGTKCYQTSNSGQCGSFFICSNSVSYPMCCPEGTAFDQLTCSCELDATCQDKCQLPSSFVQPTQIAKSEVVDTEKLVCRDAFGNYLRVALDDPSSYWQYQLPQHANGIEFGERRRIKQHCPKGLDFNLKSCTCNDEWFDRPQYKKKSCLLYMPFDSDFDDYSSNRISGFAFGDTKINVDVRNHGMGSAQFDGNGRVEISDVKSAGFNSATWCLSYKLLPTLNISGGLASTTCDGDQLSFSIGLLVSGIVEARIYFAGPTSRTITLSGDLPTTNSSFTQICVTIDAEADSAYLYINGVEKQTSSMQRINASISQCHLTIGSDLAYGNVTGFIDDLLFCPFAFSADELAIHLDGPYALVNREMIPDNVIFVDRGIELKVPDTVIIDDRIVSHLKTRLLNDDYVGFFPGFVIAMIISKKAREDNAEKAMFDATYQTCVGALIKNQWVLVSARCLTTKLESEVSEVALLFGLHNADNSASAVRYATKYYVHGAFLRYPEIGQAPFDYALLVIDRPFQQTRHISPMRIPDPHHLCTGFWYYNNNTNLTKIDGYEKGWQVAYRDFADTKDMNGTDMYSKGEHVMLMGDVTFMPRDECTSQFGLHSIVPESMMCAYEEKALVVGEIDSTESRLLIHGGDPAVSGFSQDLLLGLMYDAIDSAMGYPIYMYSRVCRVWDWIAITMKRNPPNA